MKKLHLICNSHIDPVWMWDWEEGLGTAISTFYQAAEFLDEYDYIFCHNEAILYEFIETKDPYLFKRIKKYVKKGRWRIMGGWYLQPDCNMPSGESFVRQIKTGIRYFQKKFNARPSTAINFDSFGHSIGLVQILAKCGYDSYMLCRPMPEILNLPDNEFLWLGKDGSCIKVCRISDENLYCTGFGTALNEIKRKASKFEENEVAVALWGVGNHGGGPSRKDLEDIKYYISTEKKEILHSYPERYFADIHPTLTIDKSLSCLIKAYSSLSRVKRKYFYLENRLFYTEKLCAIASLNNKYKWKKGIFEEVEKILSCLAFHDLLSGTCEEESEDSAVRKADFALELLNKEFNDAFFAIISKDIRANEGEFPIFIFNQQPYEFTTICEVEFLIPTALISDTEEYCVTAYQNGRVISSQCIKELSNINYDRRKRIAFKATLKELGVTRVDFKVKVVDKQPKKEILGDIIYKDEVKKIVISRETGLLNSFILNGKELLNGNAFEPIIYDDNPDPWGWGLEKIGENPQSMKLSSNKEGLFTNLTNVNVVEQGDLFVEIESLFELNGNYLILKYKIYKEEIYIDVKVEFYMNERLKALKLKIPFLKSGDLIGQIPFATDTFLQNGNEFTAQRFVGIRNGDKTLIIYNDGISSFSCENNDLYLTLLNGSMYCAHPIGSRPLMFYPGYLKSIEQGKHIFNFRISYDNTFELENKAQEFLLKPYALNFYPHGKGMNFQTPVRLYNKAISLIAMYYEDGGYVLRLFNNNESQEKTIIEIKNIKKEVLFNKYEVKTLYLKNLILSERKMWI